MSEKLFEALKLGKKIPDTDHFLFKGFSSFLHTVGLITCRPVFQSRFEETSSPFEAPPVVGITPPLLHS
jgi:hypothetical protein